MRPVSALIAFAFGGRRYENAGFPVAQAPTIPRAVQDRTWRSVRRERPVEKHLGTVVALAPDMTVQAIAMKDRNTFLQRLIGAAALDTAIYEEVEADENATIQACATVVLSSLAAGVGARGFGSGMVTQIAFISAIALLAWAAWALITFEIGVRLMPQPQTRSNVGELLRTIGFATAPGCLRVLGVLPGVTIPVFAVTAIWMLVAMVVAVRQALDYRSTARAVAVCGLGWALVVTIAIVLGVAFGPSLS
jgi:hypothetical protein